MFIYSTLKRGITIKLRPNLRYHDNKTLKQNSKTPYQGPRHAEDKPEIVTLGTCVLTANNNSSNASGAQCETHTDFEYAEFSMKK